MNRQRDEARRAACSLGGSWTSSSATPRPGTFVPNKRSPTNGRTLRGVLFLSGTGGISPYCTTNGVFGDGFIAIVLSPRLPRDDDDLWDWQSRYPRQHRP